MGETVTPDDVSRLAAEGSSGELPTQVADGKIVLASGMTYRVLVLPDTPFMTRALIERIGSLVQGGAAVIGPEASSSPMPTGSRCSRLTSARIC